VGAAGAGSLGAVIVAGVELLLVQQQERAGVSRRSLARAADDGRLLALRRGVYVEKAEFDALDLRMQHIVRAGALQAALGRPLVLSHWSAAVVNGLPVPHPRLERVHLTVPPGANRAIAGAAAHPLLLLEGDVRVVDGLLVTAPDRTVLDVASASSFADAVVIADAHLHAMPKHRRPDAVAALLDRWEALPARRSTVQVPEVLAFADGDAESAGESTSRVTMRALRLPKPVLQQVFHDAQGFAGRTDFWFPKERVIGEMDGRSKYLDPRLNGGDAARVVYDEKVREDRLRALSRGFVRWDYAVGTSPALLGARLARVGVLPC
jgi:hypothetical protein